MGLDEKIQMSVLKARQQLQRDNFRARKQPGKDDPLSEVTKDNHEVMLSFQYENEKPETYSFVPHELCAEDSSKIGVFFNKEEIKDMLSQMGFENEVNLVNDAETKDLSPLLFLQFTGDENWRNTVKERFQLMSQKVKGSFFTRSF